MYLFHIFRLLYDSTPRWTILKDGRDTARAYRKEDPEDSVCPEGKYRWGYAYYNDRNDYAYDYKDASCVCKYYKRFINFHF